MEGLGNVGGSGRVNPSQGQPVENGTEQPVGRDRKGREVKQQDGERPAIPKSGDGVKSKGFRGGNVVISHEDAMKFAGLSDQVGGAVEDAVAKKDEAIEKSDMSAADKSKAKANLKKAGKIALGILATMMGGPIGLIIFILACKHAGKKPDPEVVKKLEEFTAKGGAEIGDVTTANNFEVTASIYSGVLSGDATAEDLKEAVKQDVERMVGQSEDEGVAEQAGEIAGEAVNNIVTDGGDEFEDVPL